MGKYQIRLNAFSRCRDEEGLNLATFVVINLVHEFSFYLPKTYSVTISSTTTVRRLPRKNKRQMKDKCIDIKACP